ncbi:MAG: tRNA-specific 2-thiouridylase [Nitrospirae bacterium]|nr:tRNA-specific 2-thiouridylase [Nitrospirota bacterium]
MSGGVDSSVAAYLLKKQGYDVTGLSFELWDARDTKKADTCCSIETIEIAKDVAEKLGIEHYTVDVRDAFYKHVIENFCSSYISGATPNPCILCNKFIKFDFLLKQAEKLGAEVLATGHYARIEKKRQESGVRSQESKDKNTSRITPAYRTGRHHRFRLLKGIDPKKDQSYVLYVMTQEWLSKTIFPLGELKKEQTREIAKGLGLGNALRTESQEICFIGSGNYVDFIKSFAPDSLKPGPVVNTEMKVIGEHKGVAFYTIGQRKRLGVQSLKALYVAGIQRQNNTIIVGSAEDAMKKAFKVKDLNWISIEPLLKPLRAKAKVRSTMEEADATIIPIENQGVMVEFDSPQWAPAPGQSAVFYDGNIVIGGGVIE